MFTENQVKCDTSQCNFAHCLLCARLAESDQHSGQANRIEWRKTLAEAQSALEQQGLVRIYVLPEIDALMEVMWPQ